MNKNSGIWVPENLSQLKKKLGRQPSLYGLPMIHTFYSVPQTDHHGISNRRENNNELVNLFRIVVGTTWNWLMANLAGYTIDKDDLRGTIAQTLQIYTSDKSIKQWTDVCTNPNVATIIKQIGQMHYDMVKTFDKHHGALYLNQNAVADLHDYYKNHLSMFATQNQALTIWTDLTTQERWKNNHGKDAIKAFKDTYQSIWCFDADMTADIASWYVNQSESDLRTKCWLGYKTIQRALSTTGNNSKSNHGRKKK